MRELSELRQRNLLRYWLRQLNLPIPDARQLQQILHDVLTAAIDRNPCVRWPGAEVRRYRDGLYAMPPLRPHDARQRFIWRADAEGWPLLELPGVGQLRMQETMGTGLRAEALAGGLLIVQFRQGGERFRPIGRAHSQELKKLLQQAGIPPWERDRLPLVYGVIAGGSNHPGAARHPSLSKEGITEYLAGRRGTGDCRRLCRRTRRSGLATGFAVADFPERNRR